MVKCDCCAKIRNDSAVNYSFIGNICDICMSLLQKRFGYTPEKIQ